MNTRVATLVSTFLTLAFVAGDARAQCAFGPGTGTRLRVPMVRAYEECVTENINTTTESGVPACTPVAPQPRYHACAEGYGSCSGADTTSCPTHFCGDYLSPFPSDYFPCAQDSDCPAAPFSNGICEHHPANTCEGYESTTYGFSPGGSCTLSASSKIERDCSRVTGGNGAALGLPAQACHVTSLKARCRRIHGPDGVSPIDVAWGDDDGWRLWTLTRVTVADAIAGDTTQIEFPVSFRFSPPGNGSIFLDTNTAEALSTILGSTGAALPPCTHLQPVEVRVLDPDDRIFAKVGLATQP